LKLINYGLQIFEQLLLKSMIIIYQYIFSHPELTDRDVAKRVMVPYTKINTMDLYAMLQAKLLYYSGMASKVGL